MRTFGTVTPLGAAVRLEVEHTTRQHGNEVHVWICGELDIATHGQLQTGLHRGGAAGCGRVRERAHQPRPGRRRAANVRLSAPRRLVCDNDATFFRMATGAERTDPLEHMALCSEHRLT
jgi:hypothetical protein